MKLPLEWLSEYTSIETTAADFAHRMTMTGSKVEGYVVEREGIRNVVAGQVKAMERHPDSDHLWICQIDTGTMTLQIVTGAQNVQTGDMVPVALDGALLPDGKEIHSGLLRGEKSEGMLCSLGELGLTAHDYPACIEDGIMILPADTKPGADIADVVGLNDTVFEFEITPNRPDCLGVIGLAREAAATYETPLNIPAAKPSKTHGDVHAMLTVENRTPENCLRYTGAVVENVRVAPSPLWMRQRLRRCGVRPINNIVDITNYVMLEYNQPMHAFDYRHVKDGNIIVRQAEAGESLMTIDNIEHPLTPAMMIIADCEKPLALAGVMGGEYSSIVDDTTTLVFESACFRGANVRATARAQGMRTEASARFEKRLDPWTTEPAILRALQLVELLDAGDVVDGLVDAQGDMPMPSAIPLDPAGVCRFLGAEIEPEFMIQTLERLGCTVDKTLSVTPPSFRADLEDFADLAEEIARFHGYENIPSAVLRGVAAARPTERQRFERMVIELCVASGLYEINTLSFLGKKDFDLIGLTDDSPLRNAVTLSNPLGEDTAFMRTTALPAMLTVLARNSGSRVPNARLFEMARVFLPNPDQSLPRECQRLILGCYGDWDFFALKGVVEEIAARAGLGALDWSRLTDDPTFHPGRSAQAAIGGCVFVRMGEVMPVVAERYGIRERAHLAEIDLDALFESRNDTVRFTPLPKFPAITRDLALVCDIDLPSAMLESAIREGCGTILEDLSVFDVYTGDKVAAGKKSIAYSLVLRDAAKTLTDSDADGAITRSLALLRPLGAVLRS